MSERIVGAVVGHIRKVQALDASREGGESLVVGAVSMEKSSCWVVHPRVMNQQETKTAIVANLGNSRLSPPFSLKGQVI